MNNSKRWLVTGTCGQLGGYVSSLLQRQETAMLGLSRRPCVDMHGNIRTMDVTLLDSLDAVLREFHPTHIVHLAAISAPAHAQHQQNSAWSVHVEVTRKLAAFAASNDGWLLYPSTDFVWDGCANNRYRETDAPQPAAFYGRCKLAGEHAALESGAGAAVRLSLLIGLPVCPRESTWTRVTAAMQRGDTIPCCIDEFRTPLSFADAARIVVELGARRFRGVLHVAGPEVLTPHQLMSRLAEALGANPDLKPISRHDLPEGTRRPRNVAMDASTLAALLPSHVPAPLSTGALATLLGDLKGSP